MSEAAVNLFGESPHQSQLRPAENKFHIGAAADGKHYWLTPPGLYAELHAEFHFDFDPCPYPVPIGFDGLTCEWGKSSYVNAPFGSIIHEGKKKGMTAWVRKAIIEHAKGKRVVMVYPIDKWVLMLLKAVLGEHAQVRNLGDVKWLSIEDGQPHKGTGRHIACFILEPTPPLDCSPQHGREQEADAQPSTMMCFMCTGPEPGHKLCPCDESWAKFSAWLDRHPEQRKIP